MRFCLAWICDCIFLYACVRMSSRLTVCLYLCVHSSKLCTTSSILHDRTPLYLFDSTVRCKWFATGRPTGDNRNVNTYSSTHQLWRLLLHVPAGSESNDFVYGCCSKSCQYGGSISISSGPLMLYESLRTLNSGFH